MKFQRWSVSIAACAVMLLGFSTRASADIIGTGCTVTGVAGQTAFSVNLGTTPFLSQCAGAGTVTATFTFSTTNDDIGINDPASGSNTPGGILMTGGITNCAGTGGTGCTGTASAGNAGTATGAISTLYDFHDTNIIPGTYTFTVTHDDGITAFKDGVLLTPPGTTGAGPTTSETTSVTVTIAAGDTFDLVYDECCQLPGVLTANLPAESAIPEPSTFVLLGGAFVFGSTVLRRRRVRKV